MKKFLKKLFKKTVTYPQTDKIELLIIDEDAVLISEALGISPETMEKMLCNIDIALQRYDGNILLALKDVIDECVHTNEVCMISQHFALIMIKQRYDTQDDDLVKHFFT